MSGFSVVAENAADETRSTSSETSSSAAIAAPIGNLNMDDAITDPLRGRTNNPCSQGIGGLDCHLQSNAAFNAKIARTDYMDLAEQCRDSRLGIVRSQFARPLAALRALRSRARAG